MSDSLPTMVSIDGGDFLLDGIRFKVVVGPDYHSRSTDADGVVLLKGYLMATEESEAAAGPVRSIVELGVWQGGSAAFWALTQPELRRYVGIDLASVDFDVPDALSRDPRWAKVRLCGGVSQDDTVRLREIVAEEFADSALDLVIDDASHSYLPSLTSFECLFPRLRPGGTYIIEDWAWAHWAGTGSRRRTRGLGSPASRRWCSASCCSTRRGATS